MRMNTATHGIHETRGGEDNSICKIFTKWHEDLSWIQEFKYLSKSFGIDAPDSL